MNYVKFHIKNQIVHKSRDEIQYQRALRLMISNHLRFCAHLKLGEGHFVCGAR